MKDEPRLPEKTASFTDLGYIPGDSEMLEWRASKGERWNGRQFYLPYDSKGDKWHVPDDFPRPLQEIISRAIEYERSSRNVPFSKIRGKLDVRFTDKMLSKDPEQHTDVHFDFSQSDISDSLHVFLWSSEKSTTTTMFTGKLSEEDITDFSLERTRRLARSVMSNRAHLTAHSPLSGRLIVTDKFVPHSTPALLLKAGRAPRVFVQIHTWIEE